MRSRGWCFTINNYDDADIAFCMSLYEEIIECSYLIIGFESGTKNSTKHIQGYVYFAQPWRLARIRELFDNIHIEAQKSKTNVAAYAYCMEEGDYYEIGDRPRQGHRTDLEVIKHDIQTGRPMIAIAENYFSQWCQYRRAFDEYKNMKTKYNTQFICYDQDDLDYSMKEVYEVYGIEGSLILHSQYEIPPNELMSKYYSGKYKYIFIPTGLGVEYPKCIEKNISLVICQEKEVIDVDE